MLDMAFQLLAFFVLTFRQTPLEGQISLRLPPPQAIVVVKDGQSAGSDAWTVSRATVTSGGAGEAPSHHRAISGKPRRFRVAEPLSVGADVRQPITVERRDLHRWQLCLLQRR